MTIVIVHFLKKSGEHFLDLCPTYCLNDKVMKLCKNSPTLLFLFFFFSSHFRRLSQRPTAEELEQRNILQRKYQVFLSFSPLLSFNEAFTAFTYEMEDSVMSLLIHNVSGLIFCGILLSLD